jgi:hypothetical protein
VTNHYSGEGAPRVLRIGQLSGAPDAQHARLLSDVIHLLLDQYGRDAGSVLARAVVREELGEDPESSTSDSPENPSAPVSPPDGPPDTPRPSTPS